MKILCAFVAPVGVIAGALNATAHDSNALLRDLPSNTAYDLGRYHSTHQSPQNLRVQ